MKHKLISFFILLMGAWILLGVKFNFLTSNAQIFGIPDWAVGLWILLLGLLHYLAFVKLEK